jgi:AraC-like DNA-binding protein
MIVAHLSDRHLRAAVRQVAHPEEDVILEPELASEAMKFGYPRLLLRVATRRAALLDGVSTTGSAKIVTLTPATLDSWEAQRRREELPPSRVDHLAVRLRELIEKEATELTWVDRTLSDLGRAAGATLPVGLRAFGRRVLEFPYHYVDLYPLAEACGLTRGALKARFRRRNLASPYTYLRWFRLLATANLLADRSVTVARAARRLGFTSDGNLCRSMRSVTGLTPTEARSPQGWNRLLIGFAWQHLGKGALEAWREMEELFERRVA